MPSLRDRKEMRYAKAFVESGPDLARGWGRVLRLQAPLPLELGPMLRKLTYEGDAPGLKEWLWR